MSIVYVIQEPVVKDLNGDFRPKFDLTPAAIYGELKFILPVGPVALSPAPMIERMKTILRNFTNDDYILPTGDPAAMLAAGFVLGKNHRSYKMLRWDRRLHQYIEITVEV